jgi:hypothetical protein
LQAGCAARSLFFFWRCTNSGGGLSQGRGRAMENGTVVVVSGGEEARLDECRMQSR